VSSAVESRCGELYRLAIPYRGGFGRLRESCRGLGQIGDAAESAGRPAGAGVAASAASSTQVVWLRPPAP
jgi:hypothetical protein